MVIVPRIAAVSYLNTIPFIYGIEHEGNLRAELLLSPPSPLCKKNFAEHKADIALVPAAAVPSLADAQVVTEYCIGAAGPVRTVVLLSNEPIERRAPRISRCSFAHFGATWPATCWRSTGKSPPRLYARRLCAAGARPAGRRLSADRRQGLRPRRTFRILVRPGRRVEKRPRCLRSPSGSPARGTAPDLTEGLQHALTFGIEHTYEAILEHGFDNKPYDAYAYLTQNIDYIFRQSEA